MRILFLTQWFQPEPHIKGLPFAKKLKAAGHNVEVLTGFPNYPGGELYAGYKVRPYQREMMEGVPVHRVPIYPSHNQSGIKRMINYLSFSISALLLGPFLVKRPDVVYVYNLITLSWAAVFFKKITGSKIVYDVQDLWPESVVDSGMLKNRIVHFILSKWCIWAYRQADKIAVLSPGFKTAIEARGVDKERIAVIYNWCDETDAKPGGNADEIGEKFGIKETFNVVFAGTMGLMQGMDTLLAAANLCRGYLPSIRFVLVGGGVELDRLKAKAKSLQLANVVFIPRVPGDEMYKIWSIADVLLVHLIDNPLFRITIPSKTQAYLATGIPVIVAVQGDAADLIRQAGAGVACAPESPEALLTAIKEIYALSPEDRNRMGRNGKQFYHRYLSIDAGSRKFLSLFS